MKSDLPKINTAIDPHTLREFAIISSQLEDAIKDSEKKLMVCSSEPLSKAQLLSHLGGLYRLNQNLDQSQKALEGAALIFAEFADEKWLTLTRIRLANTFQWQNKFSLADQIFKDVINDCNQNPSIHQYLDFALQHHGKNLFDQSRFTEALKHFEEAYQIRLQKGDKELINSTNIAIETTKNRLALAVGSLSTVRNTNMAKIDVVRIDANEWQRFKSIRLASLKDSPDSFGSLYDEVAGRPDSSWRSQLTELPTFIGTYNGEDAGVVRAHVETENPKSCWLLSMWVAPCARGSGLSDQLIRAIIDWARENDLHKIILEVGNLNTAAQRLYLRSGFKANGVVGHLPPPREHIEEHQMEMKLS